LTRSVSHLISQVHIEPDLETAHLRVVNSFNPFSGLQNATYTLKSSKPVTEQACMEYMQSQDPETTRRLDDITDIYLLPPNEDPETCQVRGWFVDTCSSSFVQSSPTSQLSQRAPSLCEWKKVRRTRSFSITQHREVGGGCMRDIKKSTPSRTPLKRSCVQKAEVSLEPERHGVSISSASFKSK